MVKILTGRVRPCPMCGLERICMEEPKYDYFYSVTIQCMDCGLMGFKNFSIEAKDPIEKTIKYWNTRANEEDKNMNDIQTYILNNIKR